MNILEKKKENEIKEAQIRKELLKIGNDIPKLESLFSDELERARKNNHKSEEAILSMLWSFRIVAIISMASIVIVSCGYYYSMHKLTKSYNELKYSYEETQENLKVIQADIIGFRKGELKYWWDKDNNILYKRNIKQKD